MGKIYYKVVRLNLISIIQGSTSRFATSYKLGKFVESPVKHTPLCVFDSIQAAQDFCSLNVYHRYKIYECEIKGRYNTPWIPFRVSIERLQKLIKSKKKFLNIVYTDLPDGTVCAKQVKLLKLAWERM